MVPRPHFLLYCDGQSPKLPAETVAVGERSASVRGHWRFILEDLDAGTRLEAFDAELVQAPERAALLAVVRGLEALEQPSRVTLVTTSRYVSRGLQFGLSEWRESDYCWEHFGSVQPIRNADLWRRIDHAMQFHQIHCRWIAGQESETGEDSTQLKIEPIVTAPANAMSQEAVQPWPTLPASAPKKHPDNKLSQVVSTAMKDSSRRSEPLPAVSVEEKTVENECEQDKSGVWHRDGRRFLGAPFRALRLPSLSVVLQSCDGREWFGRLFACAWRSAKFGRIRRLAV